MTPYRWLTWLAGAVLYGGMSVVVGEIIGALAPNVFGMLAAAAVILSVLLEWMALEWRDPPPPALPGDDLIGAR